MELDKCLQRYRFAITELDSVTRRVSGNCQKLHTKTSLEANQGGAIRYLDIECASTELNFSEEVTIHISQFTTTEDLIL